MLLGSIRYVAVGFTYQWLQSRYPDAMPTGRARALSAVAPFDGTPTYRNMS
jgi:hypothetical protein